MNLQFLRAYFVRNCNGLKSLEYLNLCEGGKNWYKLMSNYRVIYPIPFLVATPCIALGSLHEWAALL
jgi:hypothetical protein